MEILVGFVVILIVCVVGYFYIQARIRRRRVENKVIMADIITREDIDILRKTRSQYFDQAVDLRRRQVELGRNID